VEGRAFVVDLLDAGEELRVEVDGVLRGGELGRSVFLDFLESVVGVGAGDAIEGEGDAGEELAGALEGDDGVVERGSRGVVGDGVDFNLLLGDAGFDGGLVVGVLDFVEGWRLVGQGAGGVEGVRRKG
jgi:hypothetical protein